MPVFPIRIYETGKLATQVPFSPTAPLIYFQLSVCTQASVVHTLPNTHEQQILQSTESNLTLSFYPEWDFAIKENGYISRPEDLLK